MRLERIFAGRREADLLVLPSVRHMAETLARRCQDETWVRSAVASLGRFSILTGWRDLEALRAQALAETDLAERSLVSFAERLSHYPASHVATLALGAKLWFRLNGIVVPWRPLAGREEACAPVEQQAGVESVVLLALTSSGLCLAELRRLRIGDLGTLDSTGTLLSDLDADPLTVEYQPRRGRQGERITFLGYHARRALLRWLAPLRNDQRALDPARLLLARPDGTPLTRTSLARVGQRGRALIQAGNHANVELCRATGDFFRVWGPPGARFTGPEELNGEEYF